MASCVTSVFPNDKTEDIKLKHILVHAETLRRPQTSPRPRLPYDTLTLQIRSLNDVRLGLNVSLLSPH